MVDAGGVVVDIAIGVGAGDFSVDVIGDVVVVEGKQRRVLYILPINPYNAWDEILQMAPPTGKIFLETLGYTVHLSNSSGGESHIV